MSTRPRRALAGARTRTAPEAAPRRGLDGEASPARSSKRPDGPMNAGHGPGSGPAAQQKAMNFLPSLKRVLGYLRPERPLIIVIIMLSVLQVAMNVVLPALLGRATDVIFAGVIGRMLPEGLSTAEAIEFLRARGEDNFAAMVERQGAVPGQGIDNTALFTILGIACALAVLAFFGAWLQGRLLNLVVQRTGFRLRELVSDKLHRLPLAYFDKQQRGELISRFTNDIDNVTQSMQQTLHQMLNAILTVIGVVVMMFVVSPLLAVIALTSVPLVMVVAVLIGKQAQTRFTRMWKATGEVSAHVEESFTGHDLITAYGRREAALREFEERNTELFRSSFGAQAISGSMMPAIMFIGNFNYVLIAVVGALRVATGNLNLGAVQAFVQYARMYTQPLTQIASMANLLQSGVASAERVFEVLDEPEQSTEGNASFPDPATLAGGRGRVEFDRVTFSYTPDVELIEDFSLVAEPGTTVAIVGPTGAGKTTVVNLLMRFYELDGGQIRLDGVDIAAVPRHVLRSRMGMVLQDTWLFEGTIRDNIAYGRPDATEEQIHAAAEAAYVDRFVHHLPQGYDTMLDDEGSNLSAGQQQLVTIARAFLADPQILILDEATSSVDTRTEVLVQEAMARLRTDRTSFVIAHRLSTIRDAHAIIVMDEGRIVEQGSHEELLARRGHYDELYRAQFQ